MLKDIWSVVRHNYALVGSSAIVLVSLLWIYGCESKVMSLKYPGQQVNRAGLLLELEMLTSEAELRIADLDKQDQFKEAIFSIALTAAESGSINPLAVVMTLSGLLGMGAVIDNRRKDVVIKTLKKKTD